MPVCFSGSFPFRFLAGFIFAAAAAWWPRATAAAADDVKGPQVEYSAVHAASGGVNTYVPGKWGILNLEVTNPLQQPHELLSTTYFDGHATLQFGRRIWLPARSRLRIGQPLLSPDLAPEARDRFEFHSLVLDAAAANVVAARDDTGQILHSGILPAQLETPITGLIDHLGDSFLPEVDKGAAYELAVAARLSERKSTRLARLQDRNYVPDDVSLQSLHQLVVADSRALDDPAGLAAIRRWVHGGGRLWVMLDRVDPRFLERILGDEFLCEVVDRVGLTSVRIEAAAKEGFSPPVESEYEQPVDLVRVVATGATVTYTVNGWPAALWKPLGAGKILVTTLGPRGWMRLRTAEDDRSSPTGGRFVLLPPMAELAKAFLALPAAPLKISQILEPQTVEYIGYSIPPRWLIASLLAGVVAAVVVLGLWLLRRGALEYLGWISSGLAVCVAVALLVIGGLNRHTISATAAAVAFTEAIAGTDDVRTRGAVALYNPESAPGTLGATRGGRLSVDMSGLEGTTRRMIWTDLDTFHWEHLALGGGQRVGTFEQSATLPDRMEARATFGREGLTGHLSVPGASAPGDALIATRFGRMGVDLEADGGFRAAAGNVFGPDQFLAAGLLSDEQYRRRRTYSQVLPELFPEDRSAGDTLLLLWAGPWNSGFEFGENRRLLGSSLIAIPLSLERPAVDTPVRIPPPFLPFRSVPQPDGTPSSPLWDHHRGQWVERSEPVTAWLRFQLPKELLPVDLTHARLVVQVAGPIGRLEISALRRGGGGPPAGGAGGGRDEVVSVYTWRDPVGTSAPIEVADRGLLQLDQEGGLLLGLAAGDPDRPDLTGRPTGDGERISYWKIESLSLELSGTVSR